MTGTVLVGVKICCLFVWSFHMNFFDLIPSSQVHEEMLSTISDLSKDNLLLWHSLSVSHMWIL
jgi:hypothetical protein